MVTGIETAGIALAILPLVVNQLDAYVQGIETLKLFRTRRYRRLFDEYSTELGNQHAILLNTLEQSLEGLVHYDDEISDLINNPHGSLWKDASFQARLAKKLDRNYGAFTRTMTDLSILLETLSRKLGLESADPSKEINWKDASSVEREIKKFKDIFSKSVYSDLLQKIKAANNSLKTLVEQSDRREESRRKHRISKKPLLRYKTTRRHARNLYNAVVRGKYWKCPCKDSHCVHLRINPDTTDETEGDASNLTVPRLRMAFSTKTNDVTGTSVWHWEEIETMPVLLDAPVTPPMTTSCASVTIDGHRSSLGKKAQKVQFVTSIVTQTLQSVPWPQISDIPPALPIPDFCSVLCTIGADGGLKKYLGSISDDCDGSHRYCFYSTEKQEMNVETQSLEDLFITSLQSLGSQANRPAFMLSRRDRLFLAATLASSVLQFHGSWLKSHWRSRDILFPKVKAGTKSIVECPYLSGHEVSNATTTEPTTRTTTNSLIRSEALFPLGLVLVELSLCQSISSLRIPEDEDPNETIANLKTASRVLQERVYSESGCRYGDVVDKCLFWSETRDMSVDDDEFQQLVFQRIVSPLVDDLRDFEGKARIR